MIYSLLFNERKTNEKKEGTNHAENRKKPN